MIVLALVAGGLVLAGSGFAAGVWRRRSTTPTPMVLPATPPEGPLALERPGRLQPHGRYVIWQAGSVVWESDARDPATEGVRARTAWERTRAPATFYDGGTRRDRK